MSFTIDYLKNIRQYLHQHPEISGEEVQTANYLIEEIEKLKPSQLFQGIGGNGFLAVFDSEVKGPSLLFRAELDGLPIQETGVLTYQSVNEGKGHQCGHDGHMAILLGLGVYLSENPIRSGKVSLLFQPAEETGEGAELVIQDSKFNNLHFDEVFALHNLPGFDIGSIVVKQGAFTAAVKSLVIKLTGKTAHAAEPENGVNPALAVAEILRKVEELNFNQPEDPEFKLATLIHVQIGSLAYGVSAGDAEIHYTCRSWTNENLDGLLSQILDLVNTIASNHHLEASHHFLQGFYANQNNKESVKTVAKVAQKLNLKLTENLTPFKWGEDFGFFTKKYKGCLFGLGAGIHQPALHHPDYDFPDELISTGVAVFKGIIEERIKEN